LGWGASGMERAVGWASRSERYLEWVGKKREDLNEYERKILRDMEESNMSYLREPRKLSGVMMGGPVSVMGS
jgi:hypothetical protein